MPDLSFIVAGVEVVRHAAAPLLSFAINVTDAVKAGDGNTPVDIHSVALRCQIRIEPARRQYQPAEQQRLFDLFGEPSRWGQTLRTMLWTHTSVIVPPFSGAATVALPVPCTYDFNVAATKYFYGLEHGDIPLCFLFSGTIFYASEEAGLQVSQISWEKEANFRLPVSVWRQMMEAYYPNTAWLCLRKDVFDQLYQYKSSGAFTTWDDALESLIRQSPAARGKP